MAYSVFVPHAVVESNVFSPAVYMQFLGAVSLSVHTPLQKAWKYLILCYFPPR